jgi:hypothetical protein
MKDNRRIGQRAIRRRTCRIRISSLFIAKKEGEDLQLVVDYRKLNTLTILDKYYMPDTQVELDKLKGKKLFSKFNIKDGYHNILIKPKD